MILEQGTGVFTRGTLSDGIIFSYQYVSTAIMGKLRRSRIKISVNVKCCEVASQNYESQRWVNLESIQIQEQQFFMALFPSHQDVSCTIMNKLE